MNVSPCHMDLVILPPQIHMTAAGDSWQGYHKY